MFCPRLSAANCAIPQLSAVPISLCRLPSLGGAAHPVHPACRRLRSPISIRWTCIFSSNSPSPSEPAPANLPMRLGTISTIRIARFHRPWDDSGTISKSEFLGKMRLGTICGTISRPWDDFKIKILRKNGAWDDFVQQLDPACFHVLGFEFDHASRFTFQSDSVSPSNAQTKKREAFVSCGGTDSWGLGSQSSSIQ